MQTLQAANEKEKHWKTTISPADESSRQFTILKGVYIHNTSTLRGFFTEFSIFSGTLPLPSFLIRDASLTMSPSYKMHERSADRYGPFNLATQTATAVTRWTSTRHWLPLLQARSEAGERDQPRWHGSLHGVSTPSWGRLPGSTVDGSSKFLDQIKLLKQPFFIR
jgi:hypothetical protein